MKICFLIDAPWDNWGGGQEHVTQVARKLNEVQGYKVDIIHPQKIRSTFNFFNFKDRLWFTFWVIKFLITSDYDLYNSHTFSTDAFLPIVKLRGRKTAITLHGVGKNLIGGGILNKLKIPKLLEWIILDLWPFDLKFTAGFRKNFIIVGNGVNVEDYNKFKKAEKSKKFKVLWLGRKYDPVKGVKYLEEAVKGLDVELDIAVNTYGEEKIKRFKQADLFVLPSLSEGFPIVLLEAMAAKLPIVTTDVGDCRKLIEEAKCGLVVPAADSKALRAAIQKIRKDKDLYGENGYKFVSKNYTWDKVASIYYSSYRRLNS